MRALILLIFLLPLAPATAQVNRCINPDGHLVFTDQRCDRLGAVPAPVPSVQVRPRSYRPACARSIQELVFDVTSAIDARDGNRLAALYNWTGMGTRQAYAVIERLDAIARRPLAEAVLVYPRGPEGDDPLLYPQITYQRAPVALRLEQTLPGSASPARTVFGVQRYFGCWWIRG